jgi:hypothetical protein
MDKTHPIKVTFLSHRSPFRAPGTIKYFNNVAIGRCWIVHCLKGTIPGIPAGKIKVYI